MRPRTAAATRPGGVATTETGATVGAAVAGTVAGSEAIEPRTWYPALCLVQLVRFVFEGPYVLELFCMLCRYLLCFVLFDCIDCSLY